MIIDVHRHMWSAAQRHRAAFASLPPEHQRPETNFDWRDAADEAVREMDAVGIDRTVMFTADFEARLGPGRFTIVEENELIAQAAKLHPGRIIPFYGIDPRRDGAAELFEAAVTTMGMRGIKLHPAVGFSPSDRSCYPIYEICQARDLPVIFHVGPGFHPRLFSRYSHPFEYDDVAADFPDMAIIMAHAGGEWWKDCIAIAKPHPNMILEVSEWQLALTHDAAAAHCALAAMLDGVGRDRVSWGSDFPGKRSYMSLEASVEVFQRLPRSATPYGVAFSEDDIASIMGGTARDVLGL